MARVGLSLLRTLVVALVCCVAIVRATDQVLGDQVGIDNDAGATVMELIQRRGYAVEEHKVVTDDRYVLTMYRLPKSYDETQRNATIAPGSKPAVYLIHGLLDSSFTYVVNYRTQSLAFLLADAGYDVWLGNNRGTTWSRQHLDFSSKDPRFWDFTWHEMGRFDLPAMLNYVLRTSQRATLSYVGHSEGTTQAFVGFSLNQQLARKVSFFGALAPVTYTGDTTNVVFGTLARTYIDKLFQTFGLKEFGQRTPLLQDFISKYGCSLADSVCDSVIQLVVGPSRNVNASRIHVYISQTPAGTSVKNMVHYAQGIRDNTFRNYDYGCACSRLLPLAICPSAFCQNKAVYGAFDPPSYELERIQYPRMVFYKGDQDSLATETDISKLRRRLPRGTIVGERVVQGYNHLDYSWAFNAKAKVYDDLIAQIIKYEGKTY